MYKSGDTRNFLSTSGLWPPSLLYDIPGHRTVFPVIYPCCLTPEIWIAVGISLLSCVQAEIYVISCLLPVNCLPSLISNTPRHKAILPVVYPCCLTPETWVQPFEFCCYHVYKLRYTQFPINFRFMAAIFDLRHTQTSNSIINFLLLFYGTENVLLPLKLCCYHVY